MDLSQFHFAHPLWLWCAAIVPMIWLLYFLYYQKNSAVNRLKKYIDPHLIPYLLVVKKDQTSSLWKMLILWSGAWFGLTIALAGPRWHFQEIETFTRDQNLVILLDLSQSMNATDVKPSRLVRARQKIEDLINLTKDLKIGLVAFAADPHMISPLTDDMETIRHLLPSLETDLAYVQGSRLSPALEMASKLLESEKGSNQAILIISDGGFEDASAISVAKKIAENGVVIHTMGIGTTEGAPVQDHEGRYIKTNDQLVFSKLENEKMQEISVVGKGYYLEGHFSNYDETIILQDLEKRAEAQMDTKRTTKIWEEHFYLFILPILPIILFWLRRGYAIALILLICAPKGGLEAAGIEDYFKNSEQLGEQALIEMDYETAIDKFQDPYRKGVAHYRAGNFPEAETSFRQSTRPEVASSAAYNLGNALVRQEKLEEAIKAYEKVLEKWPDHTKAKENLELVKQMLDQKNQNEQSSDDSQDQNQNDEENENEEGNEGSSEGSDQDENSENEEQQDQQDADQQNEEEQEAPASRSQEDLDADQWLNQINNDPKDFLKNKFYIESKQNGTKEPIEPW